MIAHFSACSHLQLKCWRMLSSAERLQGTGRFSRASIYSNKRRQRSLDSERPHRARLGITLLPCMARAGSER